MYPRLLKEPLKGTFSFFLFGPRGTGKTFWLKAQVPNAVYIDLLKQETFFELLKAPHTLEERIPKGCKEWIIIDEVQKIPELLNEVHRLIEEKRYRFILTGSSARTLKKKGVNLLGGRALSYKMFPLTAIELGADFHLEKSLRIGHLPTPYSQAVDPQAYLSSYVQTYLREEVMQEGLVRHAAPFARFLEAASFSQAGLLNISGIAQELGIERPTVNEYFQITEDLLISTRLPVFTKRAKRKMVTHSKFYYFDVGVYRALRPMGPFDSPEEVEGSALESLLLQELQAINHYFALGYKIYFWRTTDQLEVDFILYGPRGLVGLEMKRAKKVVSDDLRALRVFQEDYPMAKLYLIYGGIEHLHLGGIEAIPMAHALKHLPELLLHGQ